MESAAALLAANSTRSEGTRRALEAEMSKARAERAASCEQARKTAHLPFFVQEHYKPRPPPSKLYAWSFGAYADPATGGLRRGWQAIDVSPAAMKQLKARAPVPSKAEKEEKELDWLAPWTAHQEAGEACRQRLLAMPREAWPPRPPPDRPENVAHGYAYRTHTGRLLQIIAPLLSGSSPPTWKCIYKGSHQVELVEHRSYSLR